MLHHVPPGLWFGCRARRTAQLITVICVLSVSDLMFTLWAHQFTAFHELNPLARALLQGGQISTLILLKLLLTGMGAAILWRLRDRGRTEAGLWMVAAAYVLLTMRWADFTQVVHGIGL